MDDWTGKRLAVQQAKAWAYATMLVRFLEHDSPLSELQWLQVVQTCHYLSQIARAEHLEAVRARMPGVFEMPFRGGEA